MFHILMSVFLNPDLEGVVGAKPEQILDQAGERDLAGQPDLLTRIYGLEEKVKGHLSGALDIEQDTGMYIFFLIF